MTASSDDEVPSGQFPVTVWENLQLLKDGDEKQQDVVLNDLCKRYRKPILIFLKGNGHSHESAEDLVQGFFLYSLNNHLFKKADVSRGRFRNLVLSALKNYVLNERRRDMAQRRHPSGGFVEVDDQAPGADAFFGVDHLTPDHLFDKAWADDQYKQALDNLEKEYVAGGKIAHFEIFKACVWEPVFKGMTAPKHAELAQKFHLTEKEVSNHLITAKRAYDRILSQLIQHYAPQGADLDDEIRDLTALMAIR